MSDRLDLWAWAAGYLARPSSEQDPTVVRACQEIERQERKRATRPQVDPILVALAHENLTADQADVDVFGEVRMARAIIAYADAELHVFDRIGADRLADEVSVLVRTKVIDARSPAADALLDYRNPPVSERSDRIADLQRQVEELSSWASIALVARHREDGAVNAAILMTERCQRQEREIERLRVALKRACDLAMNIEGVDDRNTYRGAIHECRAEADLIPLTPQPMPGECAIDGDAQGAETQATADE